VALEVDGRVDGVAGTFALDTGNEVAFSLESQFVKQNNLIEALGARYHGYSGRSYAGATPVAYYARAKTLQIGDAEVHDLITYLFTGEPGPGDFVGNIGRSVLRQFNVTFDCMRGNLYLEKNANWGKRGIFNRAGIVIDPTDKGGKIMTVLPGSPGEAAGLAVDDLITKIDGHAPSDDLEDPAFLQAVGTVVHLTIKHGDQERQVYVTLKEIL
jgi:PDZ domain